MIDTNLNWKRIPLKKAYNVRELGGYLAKNDAQTKWHAFLRSDSLEDIDSDDIGVLKSYGVNTVIDLRGIKEVKSKKNPLEKDEEINYYNIPIEFGDVDNIAKIDPEILKNIEISSFYISVINEINIIKEIFEIICNSREGCILFHCTAGKDRTGTIAMLLLGLVGVNKVDIMANYQVSYSYVNGTNRIGENLINPKLSYSNPEYIEYAYDYIIERHNSVENYLISIGISSENIDRIIRKII